MELEPKHCTKVKKCRGPTGAPGEQGVTGPTGAPGEATIIPAVFGYGILSNDTLVASTTVIPFSVNLTNGIGFNSDGSFSPSLSGTYSIDIVINGNFSQTGLTTFTLKILESSAILANVTINNNNVAPIQVSVPISLVTQLSANVTVQLSAVSGGIATIYGNAPSSSLNMNATSIKIVQLG